MYVEEAPKNRGAMIIGGTVGAVLVVALTTAVVMLLAVTRRAKTHGNRGLENLHYGKGIIIIIVK